ncbi:DUF2188 domain-containing protein [Macrococcoides caseolyticum]|uniref:DUF2188 domain-containing protein n=1 Tax=Macrococcoides caseolyticum TaxID=69966 RepID=UPI001F17A867|nr:DUF2188 domain-containing protein [Macrococcus caseolyticus]MCE4956020.1 DUF2188 domain-containing protein [Macrococcus caseolyticus]
MWTMNDYPNSWKNFDELERKKAIDIGNAMLKQGYKKEDLIPIATKQAQDWYKDAKDEELETLKHKKITLHQKDDSVYTDLIDNDVEVYFEDDVWKVKTKNAKRATGTFDTKKEAVARAKEIAENRDSKVIEHKKDK